MQLIKDKIYKVTFFKWSNEKDSYIRSACDVPYLETGNNSIINEASETEVELYPNIPISFRHRYCSFYFLNDSKSDVLKEIKEVEKVVSNWAKLKFLIYLKTDFLKTKEKQPMYADFKTLYLNAIDSFVESKEVTLDGKKRYKYVFHTTELVELVHYYFKTECNILDAEVLSCLDINIGFKLIQNKLGSRFFTTWFENEQYYFVITPKLERLIG